MKKMTLALSGLLLGLVLLPVPAPAANREATPASALRVPPGFRVELLHSALESEGSWICMTIDDRGRLIVSPQDDHQPLLRITLTSAGQVDRIEPIPAPVHQAMGLLYAHNSLYVNGHGPQGTGLYRLIDTNHNDIFEAEETHFLKHFGGEGEHGYHAVVLGPDRMIYVMNGNHTKLPEGLAASSPHKNYREDFLLPRQWDANGHAVGIMAPGGHVLRTDPEGKKWELILAGFRNAYDFAFSPEGEMFTFDSDMEWDWGLPWYRPIRVIHCVNAGEYGWRSGSSKWPEYYPDSLPPVLNLGIGSPTGVRFGTGSHFPPQYREALFVQDWSYGRLFAVHLAPRGSSYTGTAEVFVQGQPLNLTHLEIGRDGAMYFITGGRGTQSGLYRVSYDGAAIAPEPAKVELAADKSAGQARELRRQLESFHGRTDPRAVDAAWPSLGSSDPFLRYAARIALEWQEIDSWKARALAETDPAAGLTALLALARCGPVACQPDLLHALERFPLKSLPAPRQLDKLRILGLSFIRQGKPDAAAAARVIQELDAAYPAKDDLLNRELSQLLIYLEAPGVVAKTLALLDAATTQEQQAHYIFHLRTLKTGWTLDQYKHYFDWLSFAQAAAQGKTTALAEALRFPWAKARPVADRHPAELVRWFRDAGRDYSDGASYPKYLVNIRQDAVASLSSTNAAALSSWTADYVALAQFKAKPRAFVKEWKMTDLEPALAQVAGGRNFNRGKSTFEAAQCLLCHRFGNEGGSVGPELGGVAKKYSVREILESIVEPSKVVSEQYQHTVIDVQDGDSETGRILDETDDKIVLQPNPLSPERIEIPKSKIRARQPSKVSPMPTGLINCFNEEEILDLLAYLQAAGDRQAPNFARSPRSK